MPAEWNEAKAASGVKKHGVTVDEAATRARLLVVVTTERDGDRIRMSSARRATAKERRDHEEAT